MLPQTQYRHPLQDWTNSLASHIWESVLKSNLNIIDGTPEVPQIIFLGSLITGYARNPGHYDPVGNLIVLNQRHKTLEMDEKTSITHELCHWLQHRLVSYRPTRDTHSHSSWSTACHHITKVLTRKNWDPLYFKPLITTRDGEKTVKVQRKGSLTPKKLHHWPRSIPSLTKTISEYD